MYNFTDTTTAPSGTFLPAEALQINGEYIENKIAGYRTLAVSGREALSPELATYETGVRDGAQLQSRRFPSRTITVSFQLIAASNAAFRTAFNQLGSILNVENAQLIFNDEQDKFFIGTPENIDSIDPGKNAVIGTFSIFCADPFKYSVAEYSAAATSGSGSVSINYGGTYKSFPTLQAEFYKESEPDALTANGDCGFVAFFNDNNKILQMGDPEEVDGTSMEYQNSQSLLNQVLKYSDSWRAAASALWTINSGTSDYQQLGALGMKLLLGGPYYYLSPTSYGSYPTGGHGVSMARSIPADSDGSSVNALFDLKFKPVFAIGSGNAALQSYGELSLVLLSASNEKVAKFRLAKNTAGKYAKLEFYVGTTKIYQGSVDVSPGNVQFGAGINNPNCRISKTVDGFEFSIGGVTQAFPVTGTSNITKIEFMFSQYYGHTPVANNGLLWVQFTKNYADLFQNIPNKFKSNDVLEVDCKNGEIKLNDAPAPELGALGNDWEQFYLSPGQNQIGFAYSDWVTAANAPSVTVKYREVFL